MTNVPFLSYNSVRKTKHLYSGYTYISVREIKSLTEAKKMETTIVEHIKKTLGNSWNGIAVNGTPFTQWMATEDFFSLWREQKEKIKNVKYSLYKHDVMGWVVTFFGAHEGQYASYDDYKKKQAEKNFKVAWGHIMGWVEESRDLSFSDRQELIEELHAIETMSELDSFVDREAENPEAVWEMM